MMSSTPSNSSEIPRIRKSAFKPHAKFTLEDDDTLRCLVARFGERAWQIVANHMPGRNARQCKERWQNYLSPCINRSPWSSDEDLLLLQKQKELGSRWVQIATFFTNRTDAMVKNRFQVLKRKELREQALFKRLPSPSSESFFSDPETESDPLISDDLIELIRDDETPFYLDGY